VYIIISIYPWKSRVIHIWYLRSLDLIKNIFFFFFLVANFWWTSQSLLENVRIITENKNSVIKYVFICMHSFVLLLSREKGLRWPSSEFGRPLPTAWVWKRTYIVFALITSNTARLTERGILNVKHALFLAKLLLETFVGEHLARYEQKYMKISVWNIRWCFVGC
jgi:hypothetical protein